MNKYENKNNNTETPKKENKRDNTLVNYNIRCANVRVVEGLDSPKIMPTEKAIELAKSRGLDLVQISFDVANHVSVAKIIDYGKFKYEQTKREKNAKKAAKANIADVKSIQFSITTDDNDKIRLIEQAKKFLSEGDKVRIVIRFRNKRESQNTDFAKDIMKSILVNFDGIAVLDSTPAISGRELACILRGLKVK